MRSLTLYQVQNDFGGSLPPVERTSHVPSNVAGFGASLCLFVQPGSDVLTSMERAWGSVGAGHTLSSTANSADSSSGQAGVASCSVPVAGTAGILYTQRTSGVTVDLEVRRARAAAAAEARLSGSGANTKAVALQEKKRKLSSMETTKISTNGEAHSLVSKNACTTVNPTLHQEKGHKSCQQRKVWVCGQCTLINDAAAAECLACTQHRPVLSSGPMESPCTSTQIPVVDLVASSGSDGDDDQCANNRV